MTTTVTIYSDLTCPWAAVAVHRLRAARDRLGLDVVFDPRAWPLEWVNGAGTPQHIVTTESAVLAAHEPELFSGWRGATWPSTVIPAFELVAAARRVGGVPAAEAVDATVRTRFFRHSADIALRHELRTAAEEAGVDADAVLRVWETEPVRADVVADYAASAAVGVQGSPQVVWPDGTTTHNPGMTDHRWVRGIPRMGRVDPGEPERLLRERAGNPLPAAGR